MKIIYFYRKTQEILEFYQKLWYSISYRLMSLISILEKGPINLTASVVQLVK